MTGLKNGMVMQRNGQDVCEVLLRGEERRDRWLYRRSGGRSTVGTACRRCDAIDRHPGRRTIYRDGGR